MIFEAIRRDVQAARDRDPAARSVLEVAMCYPGVRAVWGHRVAHYLWANGFKLAARVVGEVTRLVTGVDIHPAAAIGPGLFIDHATGVVIGETAQVGEDVTIYQGVTLGGTSLERTKRHPTVGDRVVIGAGAKLLGAITIGEGSRIGANAVVVRSVPPDSVVVGVPGQVISRSRRDPDRVEELDDTRLPDLVGASLQSLLSRVGQLEAIVHDGHPRTEAIHPPEGGVWRGEDFSI